MVVSPGDEFHQTRRNDWSGKIRKLWNIKNKNIVKIIKKGLNEMEKFKIM